jgi:polar amino acid transport system substrate-binding protein
MFSSAPARRIALRSCLAGLVLLLADSVAVRAAEAPLRLATGPDFAPFADEALPDGGKAVALVKAAFDAAGIAYMIETLPWKRGYEATAKGVYDATFPYAVTAERRQDMRFSESLLALSLRVVSARDAPILYRRPADLQGKTLCVPIGFDGYAPLAEMIRAGAVPTIETHSVAACVRNVIDGHAQFLVEDLEVVHAAAGEAGVADRIVALGDALMEVQLHLVVGKDNPRAAEILSGFSSGLQKLRDTGRYAEIVNRVD